MENAAQAAHPTIKGHEIFYFIFFQHISSMTIFFFCTYRDRQVKNMQPEPLVQQ